MLVILNPAALRARTADSLPGPGPLIFTSRFFTPQASILEDPVTGSAHCSLIPFWAERLNKTALYAQQVSDRLGKLYCQYKGDRVMISGHAKTYSIGSFWID